nr:Mur ligase domain-containing protein [Nitrospiraceae bacterium]
MLRLEDVIEATGAKVLRRGADAFPGLSIDSRTIARDELFVALRGERFDGHDFLQAALASGAAGAVIDRPIEKTGLRDESGKTILLVKD